MITDIVKPYRPRLEGKTVNIYNTIFKIHTKYTSLILLLFYGLVSAKQFFGSSICCLLDNRSIKSYVENVCWTTSTFTLINMTKTVNGYSMAQSIPQHQKYYQWIVVVLLLQAILFYTPAYLWKSWEHGRLNELCNSLGSAIIASDNQGSKKLLVDYLKSDNSQVHAIYVVRFVVCEVLNLLIVVLNMWIVDANFGQFWIRYFPAVSAMMQFDGELFSTLANEIFPKLVKCSYTIGGPSGSQQLGDAKCLLAQNILNEKIFAFLYIWFIMLLILSSCNLIFRSISLVWANLRLKMILSVAMPSMQTTRNNIKIMLHDKKIGDWFILYDIGRNINPIVFKEVLDEVSNSNRIVNNNDA